MEGQLLPWPHYELWVMEYGEISLSSHLCRSSRQPFLNRHHKSEEHWMCINVGDGPGREHKKITLGYNKDKT